tara:strand:+ start:370 stop:1926 length:1557 start_codon:yes stop_codon:yes gene_type:complete
MKAKGNDLLKGRSKIIFDKSLGKGKIGFERESLRVIDSSISRNDHPISIGSALCNKYITTDFSEAQIELITPPLSNSSSALSFLEDIHHFVSCNIGDEILWPFSMPPYIDNDKDIPIAKYGSSNLAIFKQIYRKGLSYRYGSMMQVISGFHFNYSFSDSFWLDISDTKKDYLENNIKSHSYFAMIRNIQRYNWLILYLFGASPLVTSKFIGNRDISKFKKLEDNIYYMPFATSLRMSEYGYQNLTRKTLNVSFESLNKYVSDLQNLTQTKNEDYLKITKNYGLQSQLNPNILQIEDEYYSVARPKSIIDSVGPQTAKLQKSGVDFIELRSLDLNPYSRIGIDKETVIFVELFLYYCALGESDPISIEEGKDITSNDLSVSKYGRRPNLKLTKDSDSITLNQWGRLITEEMIPIAEAFGDDSELYLQVIERMRDKLDNPEITFSGRILDYLLSSKTSYIDFGNSIGESNKSDYLSLDKSLCNKWDLLESEIERSIKSQKELELLSDEDIYEFISNYSSY